MSTFVLDISEEVLAGMQKEPEAFAKDLRLAGAVKWFEIGEISQEKAAAVAGLSRAEFIGSLARFGVSPMQETADEVVAFVHKNS